MHRSFTVAVVFAIVTTGILAGTEVRAGGGSGWGWAKPMNKRMGAFYTSNRNANFSRSSQPRHVSTPYHKPYQRTYQPTYHQSARSGVTRPYVASPVVTHAPAVTHAPVVTGRLPNVVKSPVPNVSVPPTIAPKPIANTSPVKSHQDVLPHKSTANTFWQ